jgi:hypothetical protein
MTHAIEQIREITKIPTFQISIGWNYFVLAKFIGEAYANGRVKRAHEVLTRSYAACWDAAVLSVTQVMDKQPDSLRLSYLLNCVEASFKDYPSLTTDELKNKSLTPGAISHLSKQEFLHMGRDRSDRCAS